MVTKKILDSEIESLKVASLPTRPTAPTAFGGKGYTSAEMKAAFDKLPLRIIEEFNTLVGEIESGAVAEALCKKEPLLSVISDIALIKARLGL
ncbi:MAG: hypothetical protein IKV16_01025 [Clostridia bacterium]|nr:hypothetical protein [Clostridia bacterium]